MKALTLRQPYAQLIINGFKRIETRTWKTDYRGAIAIHAGASPKKKDEVVEKELNCKRFNLPIASIVHSSIIAIATLIDCALMTENFISQQSEQELSCGYWAAGNYAWILDEIRPIAPYPISGKLGLWNLSLNESDLVFLENTSPHWFGFSLEKEETVRRPEAKKNQSGCLYRYTKLHQGKDGILREYPLMGGIPRNPENPSDWYWGYSYVVQDSNGKWRDRSASVSRKKLPKVQRAIAQKKTTR